MESISPEAKSGRLRQLIVGALLMVWLAAVVGYSLWDDRPVVTLNHEFALGLAVLAISSGLASLLLVGRHRLPLAISIIFSLVGFGFLLELAQGKYVEAARDEPFDVVVIAIGAIVGVVVVGAIARKAGAAWTQRLVAIALAAGSSMMLLPALRSPQFNDWWMCDKFGLVTVEQPVLSIGPGSRFAEAPEVLVAGEPQTLVLNGAVYDPVEGALVFDGVGDATLEATDMANCALDGSADFTLRIEAKTAELDQAGPARLATISTGTDGHEIALHVGQDGADLSVRVRTLPYSYDQVTVPEMFADTDWHTFELRFHDGTLIVLRDDISVASKQLRNTTLSGWETHWPLTLGNEATGDRAFKGSIREVIVRSDSATQSD